MEKKTEYADIVEAKLKDIGFHFMRTERDGENVFFLPMDAENAPGLNVRLIIDKNGDSKYRCYIADKVPVRKRKAMVEECNRLNTRYRYISLHVDDDGGVCASYDFAIFGDEEVIAEHALSMLCLCSEITDTCIPHIMKTLWSKEEQEPEQPHIKMNLFQTEEGEES